MILGPPTKVKTQGVNKLWMDYRETYFNGQIYLNQARLVTLVGNRVLKDFPKRLPSGIREPLIAETKEVGQALLRATEIAEKIASGKRTQPRRVRFPKTEHSELFPHSLMMMLAQFMTSKTIASPNFGNLLRAQELVMIFAQLDGFIADSLRIICRARPETMKSDRQIDLNSVLDSGGWEQLLTQLTEKVVRDIGWDPFRRRLKFINDHFGLELDTPKEDIMFLEEADKLRNVVVHNAGKANSEYVGSSNRKDITVGQLLPVEDDFVNHLSSIASLISADLFMAISRKFLGAKEEDFSGVAMRGHPRRTSRLEKP